MMRVKAYRAGDLPPAEMVYRTADVHAARAHHIKGTHMNDIEQLNVPLPGRGKPDFQQPITVPIDGMHTASLYFDWGQQTVGFGQCSIHRNPDGTVTAATEGMGREWLRRALYAAVDALVDQARIE